LSDIRGGAKNVKEAFIRSKYIEAAKSIILRDGAQNVTVRGIAEITGYSYPMIYHFFRNLDDLLLETKLSMIGELTVADDREEAQADDPLERKKRQARQTIGFFIDNPNIFAFFYQYKLDENNASKMRSLELEKAFYRDFNPFAEIGAIREEDIPAIARSITFLVFGAVTLYLSNNGLTKDEALESVDHAIELLLKGKTNDEKR
jgi:AcrR family transcriptional regulator